MQLFQKPRETRVRAEAVPPGFVEERIGVSQVGGFVVILSRPAQRLQGFLPVAEAEMDPAAWDSVMAPPGVGPALEAAADALETDPQMKTTFGNLDLANSIASGEGSIPTALYVGESEAMFAPVPQPKSTTVDPAGVPSASSSP